VPWELVSVPASEIESDTSQWSQERSKPEVRIIGKYGGNDYEVVIDPSYLLGLKFRQCQMNLDYNPTQPGERRKAIYGTYNATRKARDQWLQHAANVLHEELARAILSHDISVCIPS
jgi:hypothetical protein